MKPRGLATGSFIFERGLTYFISSNWTESLEHFIYAKNCNISETQKMACLGNILFCTENLGLPSENILKDLNNILSGLDSSQALGVRAQLRAFDARQAWRSGNISALNLETKDFSNDLSRLNQADYLSLYLTQLPYFQISRSVDLNNYLTKAGELFNQNFRMQTLIGDRSPVNGIIRLGDWLERLYLWTWRWMVNPEKYSVSLITETLNQIPASTLASLKNATAEDQMLFKITLGWLSIFDASAELSLSSIVEYSALEDSQTFKLEKIAQQYIRAILNQNIEVASTYKANLEKSKSIVAYFLLKFATKIELSMNDAKVLRHDQGLVINLTRFEILKNDNVVLQSATLCRGLQALKEKESVKLEDLAYHTFFLKEYDSFLHGSKLSNLLTRMNKVLPAGVRVIQRDGKALMIGDKKLVLIHQASRLSQELGTDSQWQIFTAKWKNQLNLAEEKDFSFDQVRSQLQIQGEFTRQEFQLKYNVSKTQSQRIIQGWIDSGKIQKIGQGKSIKYVFNLRRAL